MALADKRLSCTKGEVIRMQFGIFGPDEIRRYSVTPQGIRYAEFYDNGRPKIDGLMDPRQGPWDRDAKCLTCSGNNNDCPGHFGHIDLVRPVFHVGFLKYIIKILRCVCYHCSRLLTDPSEPEVKHLLRMTRGNPRARFEQMYKYCSRFTVCAISDDPEDMGKGGCGRRQPKYLRNGLELYLTSRKKNDTNEEFAQLVEMDEADISTTDGRMLLTQDHVRRIFESISDETCRMIGFDPSFGRPEWMILTVIPVPPLAVRPTVCVQGSSFSQDDLTHKLYDIVATNIELSRLDSIGAPQHVIDENHKMLQYHCATLVDNEIPGIPTAKHKNGRPLKSVKMRLKGKEGRIRGNLMGKRVDFSARTVITPDPNIEIDEVGIPLSVAMKLTFPEKVTTVNRERLQTTIDRGCNGYPGAKYIIRRSTKVRCDLQYASTRNAIILKNGDIVERHLIDGDWIVFNRQPSLHKMSMMAHRVRVMPFSTFRLNLSVTTPYNADFDGDEMNLHVPQTEAAVAELSELMSVPRMIVTPQSNRPVMGIVQDTLTAVRKLTKRDTLMTRDEFMNALSKLPFPVADIPPPCIIKPKRLWSGKQLFSMLIPGRVNCMRTHATHPDDEDHGPYRWISPGDTRVLVENGKLLSGILCKKTLGTSAGSLIHVLFNELGHEITGKFFYHVQLVVNEWLMRHSHSIGVADTIADGATYKIIQEHIRASKAEVDAVIEKAQNNQLERLPGSTLKQTFESTVNRLLNQGRDVTGRSAQSSLSDRNNFKAMVIAGSKGSDINISQVIACVGQQNVEGRRIPFGFKRRTLPHFMKDDYGPESKGFVENSYLQGLTPSELFFHAMGGREGLIDTAVKTAETGYIQRRLMKTMESISVTYDGTVRNQSNQLVQVCYGEDGVDGVAAEMQSIPVLSVSQFMFERGWRLNFYKKEELLRHLMEDIVMDIVENENVQFAISEEWAQLCEDRKMLRLMFNQTGGRFVLPVNVERLIWNAQKLFKVDTRRKVDIHPVHIIDSVKGLCLRLKAVPGTDLISSQVQENATVLMGMLLRCYLCTKKVIFFHKLSVEAFDWVIEETEKRYNRALVQPGEMVGALSAQSLGEPATQMTLNTFHYAGVSAKNVTLGVPRLKEIINVSEHPKTPSMTVFLYPEVANDPEKTRDVLNAIEHCSLKDIVRHSAIYYDPDLFRSVIQEDADWQAIYYHTVVRDLPPMSTWVLRMELDEKLMENFGLDAEYVGQRIITAFGDDLFVELNTECENGSVIRVRIVNKRPITVEEAIEEEESNDSVRKMSDEMFLRCLEANLMNDLSLKGIVNVKKVYMQKPNTDAKKRLIINDKGELEYQSEWVLETDGSALGDVLTVEGVDPRRTYTNDICEVYTTLGIEAARKAIEREIHQVISFDGSYVNRRHLALVCDVMAHPGFLVPITRHGISKQDFGPLTRCTFEQSADILIEAGALCQGDNLKGISENIMLGKMAKAGTGSFDCFMNHELLWEAKEMVEPKESAEIDEEIMVTTAKSRKSFLGTPRALSSQTPFSEDDLHLASPYASPIPFSPALTERTANKPSPMGGYLTITPGLGSTITPGYDSVFGPLDYGSMYSPGFGGLGSASFAGISNYMPSSPAKSPGDYRGALGFSSKRVVSPAASPFNKGPVSPSYSPSSPSYSPGSPSMSPTRNKAHSNSPQPSPRGISRSLTAISPGLSVSITGRKRCATSIAYSPSNPSLKTSSSVSLGGSSPNYSPTSPRYSPCSPKFSPKIMRTSSSPSIKSAGSPSTPNSLANVNKYSPKMPKASPDSPKYSPSSPSYLAPSSPKSVGRNAKVPGTPSSSSSAAAASGKLSKYRASSVVPSPNITGLKRGASKTDVDERELFQAAHRKKRSG
ncbi:hypothetical protein ACOME3_009524 [Neoechinorhynchus agilis]